MLESALEYLQSLRKEDADEFAPVYDDIAQHYQHRLFSVTGKSDRLGAGTPEHLQRFEKATREMRRVERETALRLRSERRINDEVLRIVGAGTGSG